MIQVTEFQIKIYQTELRRVVIETVFILARIKKNTWVVQCLIGLSET